MTDVLILVGSLRDGFNAALATAATTLLTEQGHSVRRYPDLASLPHYYQDLDESGVDANIDAFRAAVKASDAVLFVTPEYNGGPSSLIKNALDVSSRPRLEGVIHEKPTAVIGASPSPGGTASARAAMLEGLNRAGADVVETTFGVAKAHEHLDDDGYDQEVRQPLHDFLTQWLSVSARAA